MGNIIEIKSLSKKYKNIVAVNNLNLCIKKDEVFALLGPNGAGKTTTIKMLICLEKPTSGTATVCGNDILTDSLKVKENISVCPQELAVAKKLTVFENMEMIASICRLNKSDVEEYIEIFNLQNERNQLAKTLSGGKQRKLSIAMAIMTKPKVLFLDEPTVGLDIEARYELWEIIKKLKKDTTIILTTHYLEEAEYLADRMGVLRKGELIELGSVEEIKKKYTKKDETNVSIDEIYMRIIKGEHNEI